VQLSNRSVGTSIKIEGTEECFVVYTLDTPVYHSNPSLKNCGQRMGNTYRYVTLISIQDNVIKEAVDVCYANALACSYEVKSVKVNEQDQIEVIVEETELIWAQIDKYHHEFRPNRKRTIKACYCYRKGHEFFYTSNGIQRQARVCDGGFRQKSCEKSNFMP